MSTSCSTAPQPAAEPDVQPFVYPELQAGVKREARMEGGQADSGADLQAGQTPEAREAAARETGRREGEAKARTAYDAHLAEVRDSVRSAIADFSGERSRYFEQVEAEVVRLGLNIARKILHRESQLDPLLLAGLVRVALGKIESGTRVVVRVHPQQVSECRAYFAQHMDPKDVPEVVEDAALATDHCVLETAVGTTELGIEVQLKEIEQGLFDILQQRPRDGT